MSLMKNSTLTDLLIEGETITRNGIDLQLNWVYRRSKSRRNRSAMFFGDE